VHQQNVPAARRLRGASTPGEAELWEALRDRRLGGLKFRRQHPTGRFVVDFYCPELRLAVELDGPIHLAPEVAERDRWREDVIAARGVTFVRVSQKNIDPIEAVTQIRRAIDESNLPSPAQSGEGLG
jgi:very-short-patch-repair endonuclease